MWLWALDGLVPCTSKLFLARPLNAIAESFNGLYKWELIYLKTPWPGISDVEFTTLEYLDWFNYRRLDGQIPPVSRYTIPAAFETDLHRQNVPAHTAGTQTTKSP